MAYTYCITFIKEFCFYFRFVPLTQAVLLAKVHAQLAVRIRLYKAANIAGQKAYIKNMTIDDNPYTTDYKLNLAWRSGFMSEKSRWEWHANLPEFFKRQA